MQDQTRDALNLLTLRISDMEATLKAEAEKNRQALAVTIKDIIRDDEAMSAFWGSAFRSLQASAQEHTGRMLFAGAKAIASRLLLFVSLGLIVYSIGGWSAIVKLWAIVWHQD